MVSVVSLERPYNSRKTRGCVVSLLHTREYSTLIDANSSSLNLWITVYLVCVQNCVIRLMPANNFMTKS